MVRHFPNDTRHTGVMTVMSGWSHTPDCMTSLCRISMTFHCCPFSSLTGFRWKVSIKALTISVALTKPFCCSGKSSPKSLWGAKGKQSRRLPSIHLTLLSHRDSCSTRAFNLNSPQVYFLTLYSAGRLCTDNPSLLSRTTWRATKRFQNKTCNHVGLWEEKQFSTFLNLSFSSWLMVPATPFSTIFWRSSSSSCCDI